MSGQPIRFSIFDWLDESGRGIGATYEERLKMLEFADEAGYYCYHLAEHHGTALSTTPSPSIFLSAAAQRTRRIRLGALTYLLPHYHPIRLMEEIAMLDQLSGGRVELGVSRGSSPHEAARLGVVRENARGMYDEALEIMLMGMSTGVIDFHGTYYDVDDIQTRIRPVQQPYPPLWYPTTNPESVPMLARRGFNTLFSLNLHGNIEEIVELIGLYKAETASHKDDPDRINPQVTDPAYGFSCLIHVAETDDLAMSQAREGQNVWFDNFTRRYFERGDNKYATAPRFDELIQKGKIMVGSPATVRTMLGSYLERTGANYFAGAFAFGNLTLEQITTSLDLFAREVIPAVSAGSGAAV